MKTRFARFRFLLPLIMTSIQLGLLAAALIIHREPWVLSPPSEFHAQSTSDCSGEDCTVTFTPTPEPRAGRILKAAMLLNLPAVFLGATVHLVAVLIHLPHPPGEPTLLASSALFVPLIWFRIGKWVDRQLGGPSTPTVKSAWTIFARTAVWCLFAILSLALVVERHREPQETKFVMAVAILWSGTYLSGGLLGDWRRAGQLRAFVV